MMTADLIAEDEVTTQPAFVLREQPSIGGFRRNAVCSRGAYAMRSPGGGVQYGLAGGSLTAREQIS